MKTKLLLILLCLITINVHAQARAPRAKKTTVPVYHYYGVEVESGALVPLTTTTNLYFPLTQEITNDFSVVFRTTLRFNSVQRVWKKGSPYANVAPSGPPMPLLPPVTKN